MLSYLAFSGRHPNISLWVLTQNYNSVLTDLREQVKWVGLFYCKDRDSFNECLRENGVIGGGASGPSGADKSTIKTSWVIINTRC